MTTTPQDSFLRQASAAARAAGHIFPDYAACEAALESTWGRSRLAREANNLFGQKESAEAIGKRRHPRSPHAGISRRPLGHRHRALGPLRRSGSLLPRPHGAASPPPAQLSRLRPRPRRHHRRSLRRRGFARLVHRSAARREGPRHPSPALRQLPAAPAAAGRGLAAALAHV